MLEEYDNQMFMNNILNKLDKIENKLNNVKFNKIEKPSIYTSKNPNLSIMRLPTISITGKPKNLSFMKQPDVNITGNQQSAITAIIPSERKFTAMKQPDVTITGNQPSTSNNITTIVPIGSGFQVIDDSEPITLNTDLTQAEVEIYVNELRRSNITSEQVMSIVEIVDKSVSVYIPENVDVKDKILALQNTWIKNISLRNAIAGILTICKFTIYDMIIKPATGYIFTEIKDKYVAIRTRIYHTVVYIFIIPILLQKLPGWYDLDQGIPGDLWNSFISYLDPYGLLATLLIPIVNYLPANPVLAAIQKLSQLYGFIRLLPGMA